MNRHDSQQVNVGVVGYGSAAKVFHVPLIQAAPGLVLKTVSSRDPAKVHADLPETSVEASAEALIARTDIDLIVLPTPNTTHFALAHAALSAGKHVVVDKPFTLNLADAEALADLAARQNRLLTVFHNRRWDADFLAVKQLMSENTFGQIVGFESTFHYFRPTPAERWRERSGEGGGVWNDLGPHLVDQVLQLFGLPLGIYLDADTFRPGGQTDDYFTAILRYPTHRAVLRVNASAGVPAPRFIVQGRAASFVKWGSDRQEDALRAGARPPTESGTDANADNQWGLDPVPGQLTRHNASRVKGPDEMACPPGNYPAFYRAVSRFLNAARAYGDAHTTARGKDSDLVDVHDALAVMAVLDAGRKSLESRSEQILQTLHFSPS